MVAKEQRQDDYHGEADGEHYGIGWLFGNEEILYVHGQSWLEFFTRFSILKHYSFLSPLGTVVVENDGTDYNSVDANPNVHEEEI